MNRFFLTPDKISEQSVTFPSDISHQILHVLRLGDGDIVEVLDNQGSVHNVSLRVDINQNTVNGIIVETGLASSEPQVRISLYFGLSNREKVEWILQKGTEIGVVNFFPFVSSRTLVRSEHLSKKKIERWERIIREAAEQSGRGALPILNQPEFLGACFSTVEREHGLCLIAWEEAQSASEDIAGLIKNYEGKKVALFVGPEGGFSKEEINLARISGCHVVSLGKQILRMETAALIFPALVLHDFGEL